MKDLRHARRTRGMPDRTDEDAVVAKAGRLHCPHQAFRLETPGIVVWQESEKLTGKNQGRDRFLVEPRRFVRQAHLLADFHVGGVISQPRELIRMQALPGQLLMPCRKQRMPAAAVKQHGFAEQLAV